MRKFKGSTWEGIHSVRILGEIFSSIIIGLIKVIPARMPLSRILQKNGETKNDSVDGRKDLVSITTTVLLTFPPLAVDRKDVASAVISFI